VVGPGPTFLLSTNENAAFKALNKLWADGASIARATAPFSVNGRAWAAGTFVVRGDPAALRAVAEATGVSLVGIGAGQVEASPLRRPRIALYQSYVVSTHNPDEGWTRWVLEAYGFDYKTVKDQDVRTGDLSQFDAIILPDQQQAEDILRGYAPGTMPPEYTGGVGAEGSANVKRFVERGGTLIAFNQASTFAMSQLGLPVRNAVENVPTSALLVPGSLLRTIVDNSHPLAYGMPREVSVMYYRRQATQQMAFAIVRPAGAGAPRGASTVGVPARFADSNVLMSGWGLGVDQYLAGTPAIVQVPVGNGNAVLMNFRPQFRDQARGTFKFLFNAMLLGSTTKAVKATE